MGVEGENVFKFTVRFELSTKNSESKDVLLHLIKFLLLTLLTAVLLSQMEGFSLNSRDLISFVIDMKRKRKASI